MIKMNTNYLKNVSLIKFTINEEMANTYREDIITPIMKWNGVVEAALIHDAHLENGMEILHELEALEETIVDFNGSFIDFITDLSK